MPSNQTLLNDIDWYRDEVIFLTGATGNLGGCLLYKLALQLPTKKIYVLCRGSIRQSLGKWESSMPEHIDDIFDTGKVHCVNGDMMVPDYGLKAGDLEKLWKEVTLVIHAAANIDLFQALPMSLQQNCLPVIRLAQMVSSFTSVKLFVHISSASSCTFLPPGDVTEKTYRMMTEEEDSDRQVVSILADGYSAHQDMFASPYAHAKYLSERKLLDASTNFPVLIIRPSSFGPAISDPFPFYGPTRSMPVDTLFSFLIENPQIRNFGEFDKFPHDAIVDEIPVDLVANTCLLHMAQGTTGVVHACAQLYIPRTLGEQAQKVQTYTPKSHLKRIMDMQSKMGGGMGEQVYEMLKKAHGHWRFDCSRSEHLRNTTGPIGLSLGSHDAEAFFKTRMERSSGSFVKRLTP